MPSSYELSTLEGLSKQCWLTKNEQHRFRSIIMQWRKENKDASIIHQMMVESLVRVHIFEQRLIDNRTFFDGSATDYRVCDGRKTADMGDEDRQRKEREYEKWMPQIMRWKNDLLKIAMASKIEITGEGIDLASLIQSYKTEQDGESTIHKCNGCRIS